jgi:hypothetical protein
MSQFNDRERAEEKKYQLADALSRLSEAQSKLRRLRRRFLARGNG